MSGLEAIPARVLIDEAMRRLGADEVARRLGLSSSGDLLTMAVQCDRLDKRRSARLRPALN
jgi:hypothetical protein